tara:strand:+ start:2697 stop:4325 length:1629 start_codon:yes stop_codon:yes gene_type:complete
VNLDFNKNDDFMRLKISDLKRKKAIILKGGGKEKIKKQHEKGKLTARERIDFLKDSDAIFFEIGLFAGYEMYPEHGGCPAGGVIAGITYIKNRMCIVVANDATVKAGAWMPITAKKNLRLQEIAMENRLPIIYLVDSAGVFLPMQDEIFADKDHFGRIFRNNAKMSSMGIVQIAAIMGSCVAGGAYLPIMSDESIIVNKTGSIFLAGSYLVKAAIGEEINNENLGGASTHCEISGVTDYKATNDKDALKIIQNIIDKAAEEPKAGFNRKKSREPKVDIKNVYGILPKERSVPYDMKEIIKCLVDNSEFEEYKKEYGKSIICAYARVDGWSVGIVANQRKSIKTKKGEIQLGGVIYSDSAIKSARFIANCNQKKIPLVFLQDVTGFMVGSRSEHGGIIKDGAKMVNTMSNSIVPKFTIIIGNSYGAGNYAMCGKAYDPRLIVSWPTAKIAVMGGEQAAKVLLQIKKTTLKKQGKKITKEVEEKILNDIVQKYNSQTTSYFAASRLWVDAIIDPTETRRVISLGIDAANNSIIKEKYNPGIIQT